MELAYFGFSTYDEWGLNSGPLLLEVKDGELSQAEQGVLCGLAPGSSSEAQQTAPESTVGSWTWGGFLFYFS